MNKAKSIIPIAALIIFLYACSRMISTPTMILSPSFLVAMYGILVIGISFTLGAILKVFFRKISILTLASLFVITISTAYIIYEYRPRLHISIPADYAGEVMLFVTDIDNKESDLHINKFGIGYITSENYKKGFNTKVMQGGNDITSKIEGYSTGGMITTTTNAYRFDYISFNVPGANAASNIDINELIKLNAIDTARLRIR